jgi:hypothetical protein
MLFSICARASDEIILKTGEKISGYILDKRETTDLVVINVSGDPTIVKSQEVKKDTIQEIKRDRGDSAPAFNIELPRTSTNTAWYQDVITKQFQPWLKRYSQSPLIDEMQKKIQLFQAEEEQVEKGNIREGEKWYTAQEWVAHKADLEARFYLAKLKAAISDLDYIEISDILEKTFQKFPKSPILPEIGEVARNAIKNASPSGVKASLEKRKNSIQLEWDKTIKKIQAIVNQTPPPLHSIGSASYNHRSYWYHPGASKPDFNTADILSGREKLGENGQYITCDLNPGDYWLADDCEFNSQLKYFYTDRNVPKKKLEDLEVKEVIRLYRILGRLETAQSDLPAQIQDPATFLSHLKQTVLSFPQSPFKQ